MVLRMKCLDTYALVEINNGSPKFANFLNEEIAIADVTMAEFYGYLYRKYDLKTADYWHRRLRFLCKPVSREVMIKAVMFKVDNSREGLSFFDCVGYTFAVENGMKFVTGDKEFQNKPGVEFMS